MTKQITNPWRKQQQWTSVYVYVCVCMRTHVYDNMTGTHTLQSSGYKCVTVIKIPAATVNLQLSVCCLSPHPPLLPSAPPSITPLFGLFVKHCLWPLTSRNKLCSRQNVRRGLKWQIGRQWRAHYLTPAGSLSSFTSSFLIITTP